MRYLSDYAHSHLVTYCDGFRDMAFEYYATIIRFLDGLEDQEHADQVIDNGWPKVYQMARRNLSS